ncbi:hypothetical protein [Novosphingobium album (ex Hu et al. 2023)]|uniref:Lysoplasmalogenase n=1 Tax=Novosphingobium album (ex Hu et al. 2023) TaxID=2930093 RepID=A0ABT0AYG7_9SPHN|nr:hypothetical protein [Novosphingobium album (ex Hu et al. 2023)]MCJ2177759.1 hypothetical protein [Novosphingobium album (ex Hu et al. 2023)]
MTQRGIPQTMPRRALIERRPWLLTSILFALAFAWLQDSQLPGVYLMVLKAAPLLLLAVYAALRHKGHDTQLLAAMLAFQGLGAAISDLAEDLAGIVMVVGFAFGIGLFLMHRRRHLTPSQKGLAVCLLLLIPAICQLAINPHVEAGLAPLYFGAALGGFAASAWTSSFPRYRTGLGALVVVAGSVGNLVSLHAINGPGVGEILGWPLFYLGNLVLATGVTGELRARAAV